MKQSLKLYRDWIEEMHKTLENRTKVLNPFRLDPNKHIYQFSLTPEQWAAFRMLRPLEHFRGAISTAWHAHIVDAPPEIGIRSFAVRLNRPEKEHFYPEVTTPWHSLPGSVRNYIVKWVEVHNELEKEETFARRTLNRVGDAVNTWGQLARLWPGIVPYFPNKEQDDKYRREYDKAVDYKKKAIMARSRSALPAGLTVDGEGGEADPMLVKQIDEAQWIFSQCMMLPKYSEADHGPRPDVRMR